MHMEKLDNLLSSIKYDTMVEEYISTRQQQVNQWCYQDEESVASSRRYSDSKSIDYNGSAI